MTETIRIPVPTVAPLGIPVDRDSLREVWDCYVKPGQDAGNLQSVEERILMAVLRAVYVGLGPTDREPGEFPDLLPDEPERVKPSREDVARALAAPNDTLWDFDPSNPDDVYLRDADAVLALLPGRTEAEVKAEALEEAADSPAVWGVLADSLHVSGVRSWLRHRAAALLRGESHG